MRARRKVIVNRLRNLLSCLNIKIDNKKERKKNTTVKRMLVARNRARRNTGWVDVFFVGTWTKKKKKKRRKSRVHLWAGIV